ncbi:MAG: M1 family metallopeptidase, partial [Chitinophagaceae bacterium]|nr:M1 family metallopeptidase [Chitinophagaceae bacterium]
MKRKTIINYFFLIIIIHVFHLSAKAQNRNYNNFETFNPVFYPDNGDEFRTAAGTPGAKYWQNKADYKIDVVLDEVKDSLSGTVLITYTNNSPDIIDYLWIQLDQNQYKNNAIRTLNLSPDRLSTFKEKGYHIFSVQAGQGRKLKNAEYKIDETRMQIRLADPLAPKGGKIQVKIAYGYSLPESGRSGIVNRKNGKIYATAQWYPRMCVYDNIYGWNTLPYIGGGEFYLEYGDIEFSVNVPSNHIVGGSGELMNEKEVLSDTQIQRLKQARSSDKTVIIRSAAEAEDESKAESKSRKTWKFKAINVRDASWSSSASFIWDAARANLPDGKHPLAMSMYPSEDDRDTAWRRSTQFVKASLEFYSGYLVSYPYPVATNVACDVLGMEYPGIVFCGTGLDGKELWRVADHEIGHQWFPMLVGSDERRSAWMDEGFNTFINILANRAFNNAEFISLNV